MLTFVDICFLQDLFKFMWKKTCWKDMLGVWLWTKIVLTPRCSPGATCIATQRIDTKLGLKKSYEISEIFFCCRKADKASFELWIFESVWNVCFLHIFAKRIPLGMIGDVAFDELGIDGYSAWLRCLPWGVCCAPSISTCLSLSCSTDYPACATWAK